jgi:stage II sporulation protein D
MERNWKQMVAVFLLGFMIPGLAIRIGSIFVPVPNTAQTQPSEIVGITVSSRPTQSEDTLVSVLMDSGTVQVMELESYLLGVLLGEVPASFEMEALKAQAVACRTYALMICAEGDKHSGAVCLSAKCCQGYMTQEDYLQRGWQEKYVQRVRTAVMETAGMVLKYDGRLIRSTYFSCSGGATESALEVWGRDYPYLQSVESPGEEETVYYTDTRRYSFTEFQQLLGVVLEGSPETWFGGITYTAGGGIDTMDIGGVSYRGTTLRAILGLRSTVFRVVVDANGILLETHGYGHRVGMSQYGADAMAMEGYSYDRILAHYYHGTTLERLE